MSGFDETSTATSDIDDIGSTLDPCDVPWIEVSPVIAVVQQAHPFGCGLCCFIAIVPLFTRRILWLASRIIIKLHYITQKAAARSWLLLPRMSAVSHNLFGSAICAILLVILDVPTRDSLVGMTCSPCCIVKVMPFAAGA